MSYRCRFIAIFVLILFLCTGRVTASTKITFSADKLQGTGSSGKTSTKLIGNAKVTVDTLTINGEAIELYGKDYRYIKASGVVNGSDSEKGFSFSASSLLYDREKEIALFIGSAKVEDLKNKVKTAAERIEYNQKNETILLQIAVTLTSKDISCNSLFALYYRNSSLLELTGKPVVKKGKDEFKAARISVNLDTEDIRLEGKVAGTVTDAEKDEENAEAAQPINEEAAPEKKDSEDVHE